MSAPVVIGPATIHTGDCREVLARLPAESVQACVTSPPYLNLRDYGHPDQIGREKSPQEYVAALVDVFKEVRRVLRHDAVAFLNLGDAYGPGKQLLGMPWRVAFALQDDGWVLRSAIVWHKPRISPESVRDRPTSAYEHVFLLAKSPSYFYDGEAVREPCSSNSHGSPNINPGAKDIGSGRLSAGFLGKWTDEDKARGRNCRNVWTITPRPDRRCSGHFALMPVELAERCVKAGSRPGDVVLDPFCGAATTLLAASRLGRRSVGVELNPAYVELAASRLADEVPLFAQGAAA